MKKKLKNIWKPMVFATLLVAIGAAMPNGKRLLLYMGLVLLILLLLFIVAMYLLDRYQKQKAPYLTAYLESCDANAFLKACEELETKKPRDTAAYYEVIQDLISAYLVNGAFDSARKWLAYMESKQNLAKKFQANVKHLGVLCAVMENDAVRGNRLLDDMRNMVKKQPKNKMLRQKLASSVLVMDAHFGDHKLAKDYYEKLFAKGTRNLSEKVWCKYHLLSIYTSEGEHEKVEECLTFLDTYGNNTYMANMARKNNK